MSLRNQQGIALLLTLILVSVLLVITLLLMKFTLLNYSTVRANSDWIPAYYAAESGGERCVWVKRKWNDSWGNDPGITMANGALLEFVGITCDKRVPLPSQLVPMFVQSRFGSSDNNRSSALLQISTTIERPF